MSKKDVLGFGVILVILIIVIGFVYLIFIQKKPIKKEETPSNKNGVIQEIKKENFTFTKEYKGNNLWEYKIVGELPNPCYTISTSAVIRESYPEQVSVISEISKPNEDEICVQVISPVNEVGQFEASENAVITFDVNNK